MSMCLRTHPVCLCAHHQWQTAEQAEEMRDRERHAHKDKRDRHRDSAHVRARRTGSASSTSDTAGNDAGGESSEGVRAGGRWQMLPRYDTGQGGQKGGVGGGRGFVAKELEYGFREMSLPPPATSSSSLLAHFVSPRAPPRPTGMCRGDALRKNLAVPRLAHQLGQRVTASSSLRSLWCCRVVVACCRGCARMRKVDHPLHF